MDKISIIIPTYNADRFLDRSIGSALEQEYGNLEIIISDNASTDNTQILVRKYLADKRVKYFRNDRNIGMMPNHKIGLYERASGTIALILPADDFLIDSTYLTKAASLFIKHPDMAMVLSNSKIIYADSNDYYDQQINLPEYTHGSNFYRQFMLETEKGNPKSILSPCSNIVVFKRDIAMRTGCFSRDIRGADWELLFLLCQNGAVGFIPDLAGAFWGENTGWTKKFDMGQLNNCTQFISEPAYKAIKTGWNPKTVRQVELRLLRNFFDGTLKNRLQNETHSLKYAAELFLYLWDQDKRLLTVFLKPNNILRSLLIKTPRLINLIRSIYTRGRLSKYNRSTSAND